MKDINIDELKQTWRHISIDTPAETNDEKHGKADMRRILLELETVPTVKRRLISRLKKPLIAAVMCVLSLAILMQDFNIPTWFIALYSGFIVLAISLTLYQIKLLRNADFAIMPTIEAISFIKRFTIIRQRIKVLLLSLGIPVIVLLMWVLDSHKEPVLLIGGIAGAIIGGAAGFYMNHRFKKDLKYIETTLGSIDDIPN